jgi:YggT family protein
MISLYKIIHLAFWMYTILLMVRILSSWIPQLQHQTWVRFIAFYTDPYLGLFRRVIPPIGGVLDLSPMLAFFALRIAESLILGCFR